MGSRILKLISVSVRCLNIFRWCWIQYCSLYISLVQTLVHVKKKGYNIRLPYSCCLNRSKWRKFHYHESYMLYMVITKYWYKLKHYWYGSYLLSKNLLICKKEVLNCLYRKSHGFLLPRKTTCFSWKLYFSIRETSSVWEYLSLDL